MYANPNGITSKQKSLKSALEEQQTTIALLAETKLEKETPSITGYQWLPRHRKEKKGGGVAILYSNDIKNNITEVKGLDENDLEVKWAEMKSGKKKMYIGVYYGLQERAPKEEVQREFDTLKTHINKLKQDGDVILAGDFNAKLELNIPDKNIYQSTSRNGEMLKELLEDTDSQAINTKNNVCEWTRENRKKSR